MHGVGEVEQGLTPLLGRGKLPRVVRSIAWWQAADMIKLLLPPLHNERCWLLLLYMAAGRAKHSTPFLSPSLNLHSTM